MTCVVGLVENNKIYLGGDSLTSIGDRKYTKTLPKVVNKGNKFLIGSAGDVSATQPVLFISDLGIEQTPEQSDMEYMIMNIVEEFRRVLMSRGKIISENGEEHSDVAFLIGYNNKLYHIDPYFSVMVAQCGYDAIGTGQQVALGSLYTTSLTNMKAEERIKIALEAAAEHHCDVIPPFKIISFPEEDD
jgi:ATP-dependent protease HslVU (ClpYQ) peptidase subunit